jgi:NTP pyrophosphatase (non-canonical NTP hydrolase)
MTLDEYERRARSTAAYPSSAALLYPVLKLAGEAGEVAEKLGKAMRDRGWTPGETIDPTVRDGLIAELGDVLWYVASGRFLRALSYEASTNLTASRPSSPVQGTTPSPRTAARKDRA